MNFSVFKKWYAAAKKYVSSLRFGSDAHFDWKIILIVFVVINIASVIFSVLLFRTISQGDLGEKPVTAPSIDQNFNRKEFRDMLDVYKNRAGALEDLKKTTVSVPDPSI